MKGITSSLGADSVADASKSDQDVAGDERAFVDAILNGDVSPSTRETIAKATTAPQIVALTLGSPEFQRR